MIDLSVVRDIVTIFSFVIGLTYYIMNLRNQEKTRQMQVITRTYDGHTNEEVITRWVEIMSREWDSPEDYFEKYPSQVSFYALSNGLERIGIQLKRGLVDRSLVYEFYPTNVTVFWEKYESVIKYIREHGNPNYLATVEFLADELEKERILRGDNKVTPQSRTYRTLKNQL